jgi:hypothetical protein
MKKLIKSFLFMSLTLVGISNVSAMDNHTRTMIKATAFDSYEGEEENYYDSYEEEDNYNTKGGKRPNGPVSRWTSTSSYFTLKVVNGIAGAQTVEFFNSLNTIATVTNSEIFSGFSPFTAVNRSAATLNSVIYFDASGNLIIQSAAGTLLTISCNEISYRTLVENLKFYQIRVKQMKMTITNDPQLDNQVNVTEKTFMGKNVRNSFIPRAYFKDAQFQSKQVTIPFGTDPLIINGEKSLYLTVNQGETMSFTFMLDGYIKS